MCDVVKTLGHYLYLYTFCSFQAYNPCQEVEHIIWTRIVSQANYNADFNKCLVTSISSALIAYSL